VAASNEAAADHRDGVAGAVHWLLVQAGDWRLAIDSARVRMAVPLDGLRPSVLSRMRGNADCLGEWSHPSQPIAVIDPLVRGGLGALAEGQARQALLLDTDGGLLGLAIGAVLDVRHRPASALQPLPGGRVSRPEWFAGVLNVEDIDGHRAADAEVHPVLALDAARWTAHAELAGMASLHGERGGHLARRVSAAATAATLTLVTYALPAEVGTPIAQIDEVLPWQAGRAGLEVDGDSPWLGMIVHRQRPVVLLCLRRWSGVAAGPIEASSSILVVRSGEHLIGFVVPRLLAIESASWQSPVTGVLRSRNPTPISAARLAQIDPPTGTRRLVPVLDLVDIAGQALILRPKALAAA
jgi:chemotaxis signal transduction protein